MYSIVPNEIQNLPKNALSLTVFKINNCFHFRQTQDGSQNLEKSKFFRGSREVVLRALGSKIGLKSLSYGFRAGQHFLFLPKFKMADKMCRSLNFWRSYRSSPYYTGVQNLPEIAHFLALFKINNILHFCQNSKWWPKFRKFYIFRRHKRVVLNTQGVKNLPEIAHRQNVKVAITQHWNHNTDHKHENWGL